MRLYIIVVSTALLFSCSKKDRFGISEFPTLNYSYPILELNSKAFQDRKTVINKAFCRKLKSILDCKPKLFGLAKFILPEIDSQLLKTFDFLLIQKVNQNIAINYFITFDKIKNDIIDVYKYNPDKIILKSMYSFSSDNNSDGIAIEFIEDISNQDGINIIEHSIELNEVGNFNYIDSYPALPEMFMKYNRTCSICGSYFSMLDSTIIQFELRNAPQNEFFAYVFKIETPKGCRSVYNNLKVVKLNDSISIDSSLTVLITEQEVKLIIDRFNTECGEEITRLIVLDKKE